MIVPMKKVSLILMGDKKAETLSKLRKLGILHIEIAEGSGEKLNALKEQVALLESAVFTVEEKKIKNAEAIDVDAAEAVALAKEIIDLSEDAKDSLAKRVAYEVELERIKAWGDMDPRSIEDLAKEGIEVALYEAPNAEYEGLGECVKTISLEKTKSSVKFLLIKTGMEGEKEIIDSLNS